MIEDTLVTVIVPVHNTERYLNDCVDSIRSQTYENLEIILVDDGSTDRSSSLCDRAADEDERIMVLHTANFGAGAARNAGLREAHGSWVCFVDSDDVLGGRYVERLVACALEAQTPMVRLTGGVVFITDEKPTGLSGDEMACEYRVVKDDEMAQLLLYQQLDTAPQWGVYSRELLGSSPFPSYPIAEDMVAIIRLVAKAQRVAILDDKSLYGYRRRPDRLVQSRADAFNCEAAIWASRELVSYVSSRWPGLETAAYSRAFSLLRLVFGQTSSGGGCSSALFCELARYRTQVRHDGGARKRERLASAIACLGEGPFRVFCTAVRRLGLMR